MDKLPVELIENIVMFLDTKSIINFRKTSAAHYCITKNEAIWKEVMKRDHTKYFQPTKYLMSGYYFSLVKNRITLKNNIKSDIANTPIDKACELYIRVGHNTLHHNIEVVLDVLYEIHHQFMQNGGMVNCHFSSNLYKSYFQKKTAQDLNEIIHHNMKNSSKYLNIQTTLLNYKKINDPLENGLYTQAKQEIMTKKIMKVLMYIIKRIRQHIINNYPGHGFLLGNKWSNPAEYEQLLDSLNHVFFTVYNFEVDTAQSIKSIYIDDILNGRKARPLNMVLLYLVLSGYLGIELDALPMLPTYSLLTFLHPGTKERLYIDASNFGRRLTKLEVAGIIKENLSEDQLELNPGSPDQVLVAMSFMMS